MGQRIIRIRPEAIYEATFDDALFDALPTIISDGVSARSCTLHWRDAADNREIFGHSRYFSDEQLAKYAENFAETDLWTIAGLRRPNVAWRCSDLVAQDDYRSSAFYNDWIRAMGDDTMHCMGAVTDTRAGFGIIGLHRGKTQADFAPDEVARLGVLLPALRHMFTTRIRIAAAEARARTLEQVLTTVDDALFIVDGQCRIVFANPAADRMLEAGELLQARGRKLLTTTDVRPALAELIAKATAPATPCASDGVLFSRQGNPVAITVAPLPGHPGLARALITVRARQEPTGSAHTAAALQHRYGLTVAESEIALLLDSGRTVQEIADMRQVSAGTVRNQLKAVMWKMEVNRQSQVVAIVSRLRN